MAGNQTDAGAVSYGSLIGLNTETASPPTNSYISPDDQLQVFIATSGIAQQVTLLARILLPDGTIVPNQWSYLPQNGRLGQSFYQNLAEGFLLSLTITSVNATVPGQTFVRAALIRGTTLMNAISQVLIAGYVTGMNALSWPPSFLWPSTQGRGNPRVITGTTPAVGAQVIETVPAYALWRLISLRTDFIASAAVATRQPFIVFDNGSSSFCLVACPDSLAAGATATLSFVDGVQAQKIINAQILTPLPRELYLVAGFRIIVTAAFMQPTDQFTNLTYLVEEWLQQ